ncbi:MAG: HAD-IA family hydrolase [Sutterellaceae bacterium]|nr:HAD-IA family hydrolase [Burkholderiaceae bacterium]MCX7900945.1 HAD-IA family hydrolase [Burkholderiaceae bacterium]MDW8429830.1 HAD-IA family hydrolase [Sutterellaceae bacterium]
MLERFDAIVFDWDGTLIDSTAAIARAIQSAAADLGLPVPDFATASHVIGLGLQDALTRAVPDLPAARRAEFIARYRYYYAANEMSLALFPGARELLRDLRAAGKPLAVATGKSRVGLARALQATGLQSCFDVTRCADQTAPKPQPDMLLEIAAELAVAPARLLMVGDTTHDLQMAVAAGARAVAVTYGAHPRAQLAALAPLALFDSVQALHRWLLHG